MKKGILNQKTNVFIFTVLLLVCSIQGMSFAKLQFVEGVTTTREIAENTPKSENIGLPLRYTVEDSDRCILVDISGPDARTFNIEAVNCGVQLKTKSNLNYEAKSSYEVYVIAASTNNSDVIIVTINVTNVNDAPVFSRVIQF